MTALFLPFRQAPAGSVVEAEAQCCKASSCASGGVCPRGGGTGQALAVGVGQMHLLLWCGRCIGAVRVGVCVCALARAGGRRGFEGSAEGSTQGVRRRSGGALGTGGGGRGAHHAPSLCRETRIVIQ